MFLRTDTTLPPFSVLVYVDDLIFATADTEALAHVKSELQKRHTCTDLGELTSYLGLRITQDRAQRTITLTQSHMVKQVLQRFGFTYSSPQSTPLPTGHSLSAPPSDESVELSGPYPKLVGSLITLGMGLVLGGWARVVLTCAVHRAWGLFLEDGLELSSLVTLTPPGSNCEAEIYAGAMAAQELRWLTYLLTDLGEAPRSPPFLYVNNKAMLALCQEHRLEHRTKHIAQRYFLARELQQRRQLRLAYVASQANTADVFTKALQPCDHQRFCTVLGLELRWLTYLLTDLGEAPRSPPFLYVNNKAMLALCQEHRLEHRTKHIAQRYFLARELQQRRQLRLAYVASQANTADVFTKALQPCDHQRFCTVLGLVPTVPHLLSS
ncbi:unnamed protein product [Closterium sp. NIES-53]